MYPSIMAYVQFEYPENQELETIFSQYYAFLLLLLLLFILLLLYYYSIISERVKTHVKYHVKF